MDTAKIPIRTSWAKVTWHEKIREKKKKNEEK